MGRLRLKTSVVDGAPEEAGLGGLAELAGGDGPVGLLLWQALAEGAERADLIGVLVCHVEDLDPERAADHVDALVDRLRELDLLDEE